MVRSEAAAVAEGGALLHEWPHFLLPFLLHLLAHHPDFPAPDVRFSPRCSMSCTRMGCQHVCSNMSRQWALDHSCTPLDAYLQCVALQGGEEEPGHEQYKPFLTMLQFGLEALLLYGLASGQQPADGLPAVAKILRTIKRTHDVSAQPQTANMCGPLERRLSQPVRAQGPDPYG